MQIGLIGLGKMGYNLALNLRDHQHEVIAYDINPETTDKATAEGITPAYTIPEVAQKLTGRKAIWVMVPAGEPVDAVIAQLLPHLQPNDIIIDGGNSNYKDSIVRAEKLKGQQIHLLDCGTSGGLSGARNGACTMVGGDPDAFASVEQIFKDISVEKGYLYTGKSGSGHFVKMVHNGVEYGMMQAIAEGFEVLHKSDFGLDYKEVARVWNHGSVVRSWLMELVENAFSKDADLSGIKGIMHSSGEGKWTLETALDMQVPTPVIALSVLMRYRSYQADTFSGKVVAALRNEFGGHKVEQAK